MKHIRINDIKIKQAIKNSWFNQHSFSKKAWISKQTLNTALYRCRTSNETLVKIVETLNKEQDELILMLVNIILFQKPYTYNEFINE